MKYKALPFTLTVLAFLMSTATVSADTHLPIQYQEWRPVDGELIPRNEIETPFKQLVEKAIKPNLPEYLNLEKKLQATEDLIDLKSNGAYRAHRAVRTARWFQDSIDPSKWEEIEEIGENAWKKIKDLPEMKELKTIRSALKASEDKVRNELMQTFREHIRLYPQFDKLISSEHTASLFPKEIRSLYEKVTSSRNLYKGWSDLLQEAANLKNTLVKDRNKVGSIYENEINRTETNIKQLDQINSTNKIRPAVADTAVSKGKNIESLLPRLKALFAKLPKPSFGTAARLATATSSALEAGEIPIAAITLNIQSLSRVKSNASKFKCPFGDPRMYGETTYCNPASQDENSKGTR